MLSINSSQNIFTYHRIEHHAIKNKRMIRLKKIENRDLISIKRY